MYNQKEREELDTMEADIMADAIQEDASVAVEALNPAETFDIEQENIEEVVVSSDNSEADTETTQNETDIADQSANDETDEENIEEPQGTEDLEEVSPDTENNVLESEDTNPENPEPTSKRSKSKAREAKAWQKIEAEKAELAEERAEIAKQREEYEEKTKPPTSKEYNDLAKWYEDNGDYEKAEKAKEAADTARDTEYAELQNAQKTSVEAKQKAQQNWWDTANEFVAKPENKELQDVNTPLGQTVKQLLDSDPRFLDIPDGFQVATEMAKGKLAVSSLADKTKRIAELENEIKQLNKKTSIGTSGANEHNPTPIRGSKSLDQEEAELINLARKEDAMMGV